MKLLDIFKKRDGEDITEKERRTVDINELEIYSGMRVVVETPNGHMLFIANLQDPCGGKARLCQCSDGDAGSDGETALIAEPMCVRLRGYNNHERKAVLMEGIMTPERNHIWQLDKLTVTRVENERTYPRLATDIDGMIAAPKGDASQERPCRLLNISAGGASISSTYPYQKGNRFLLKVKLPEKATETVLYCQVLRVAEKSESIFEYGCRFLELAKADQDQIARLISDIGRT